MYFHNEGETIYLKAREHTLARIAMALNALVLQNGGQLVASSFSKTYDPTRRCRYGFIVNRSLQEEIMQLDTVIQNAKAAGRIPPDEWVTRLAELQAVPNDPLPVQDDFLWTSFVLDGIYYHFSAEDNPFFEDHYTKARILCGGNPLTYRETYFETFPNTWKQSIALKVVVAQDEIQQAAQEILRTLLAMPIGEPVKPETKRTRVPNTYDGGYHYENVPTASAPRKLYLFPLPPEGGSS